MVVVRIESSNGVQLISCLKMKQAVIFLVFSIFCCRTLCAENTAGWVLETTDTTDYTGISVASGSIGILPWKDPFSIRHVVLNHVFDIGGEFNVPTVLLGINPFVLEMVVDGQSVDPTNVSNWHQSIDMKRAVHTTSFTVDDKVAVKYEICALRNLPQSGLIRVEMRALKDVSIGVKNSMAIPPEYVDGRKSCHSLEAGKVPVDILGANAWSSHRRHRVAASSMFIYPKDKFLLTYQEESMQITARIPSDSVLSFALVGAICSTKDNPDPVTESERQVVYALHEGLPALLDAHYRLWDELWKGDIVIEGDPEAQLVVRSALYNLYSFGREGSRLSISPMGLSSQGYCGHIFWDAELWIYPPMLLLNQGIARAMMDYRTDRLDAARRKALQYGYRGAMYPWQSIDTGDEATPTFSTTGTFEHHIVADVAIAAWNYYCVSRDKNWLRESGWPMIRQIGAFWVSRVKKNADGSYSVCNVIGADEYAEGKTDNAFTNGAAIKALECAISAARVCGVKPDPLWREIADKIVIHRFEDGVTREYVDYNGHIIKQADVNLLAYPLGLITDEEQQLKDLQYYAPKIDTIHGPAMSYSSLCVQYARMGNVAMAVQMFDRCYKPNLRPPFAVIAETPSSHNPYFATGAGSILQAVLNGFAGLEITDKGIRQVKSVLPPSWSSLIVKGVGPEKKTYKVTRK